jgi:hypothetical protein
MGMEGLGRAFNVIPVAAGKSVSLKDAQGCTFICYGANEVFTLKSQPTAGGSATNLPTITDYYDMATADGASQWTDQTQAAAATITPAASHAVSFYVDAADLPSGADYVEVVHTSAGLVIAIVHDLLVQRDPASLAALNA